MDSIELTVAVSAGSRPDLRARLCASLARQTVASKIEILCRAPSPGENLACTRNRMYREARGQWVYFVDEDCELPDAEFLERLLRVCRSDRAVGGYYLEGEGIWQRAYNALACFWLDLHASRGRGLPVAGNFAIPKLADVPREFPFDPAVSFGGEEIALRLALLTHGLGFELRPELSVNHGSSKTPRGFFARAWAHGLAPRAHVSTGTAWKEFRAWIAGVSDPRVRALMVAYLATVVLARMAWHILPTRT